MTRVSCSNPCPPLSRGIKTNTKTARREGSSEGEVSEGSEGGGGSSKVARDFPGLRGLARTPPLLKDFNTSQMCWIYFKAPRPPPPTFGICLLFGCTKPTQTVAQIRALNFEGLLLGSYNNISEKENFDYFSRGDNNFRSEFVFMIMTGGMDGKLKKWCFGLGTLQRKTGLRP